MDHPFPKLLEGRTFFPVSGATPEYNCIAWALSYDRQAIWPDDRNQFGWPPQLSRDESLERFQELFELAGFVPCANGNLERNLEKVAIYAKDGCVTHAARQLASGKWTSKMGAGVDAEHPAAEDMCGSGFGVIALYMCRRTNIGPLKLPDMSPPPPLIIRP